MIKKIPTTQIVLAFMLPFVLSCKFIPQMSSTIKTTLSPQGNARIADTYRKYVEARNHGLQMGCSTKDMVKASAILTTPETPNPKKRILIQGFGPFSVGKPNISGVVAATLGNPKTWRDSESIANPLGTPGETENGQPDDLAARALQRTLTYNGISYEICSVITEILWDFTPAVVLYEASQFQPDLIIMSGRGTLNNVLRFEVGAINRAVSLSGYDENGNMFPVDEKPERALILPEKNGVNGTIQMSWHPQQIVEHIGPALKFLADSFGKTQQTNVQKNADPNNTYICNNVSFIVLNALKNIPLELAGGLLAIQPQIAKPVSAGFLHYPVNAPVDSKNAYAWGHVMMNIIESEITIEKNAEPKSPYNNPNIQH